VASDRNGVLLTSIVHRRREQAGDFPFSVPAIATLESIELDAPVTLFVGDNGTGKSTLPEALAIAAGLPAVGASRWR